MRATPLASLGLALVLVSVAPSAHADDRCGQGASAAQDAADIRGVRAQIETTCPCAAFDGSAPDKMRGAFRGCAQAVVLDAADGTPIDGRIKLRPQCVGTVMRIDRNSDCGFAVADDRHPCCQHRSSGRNTGKITRGARCQTSSSTTRNLCPSFDFVADACSDNALNTCNTTAATTSLPSGAAPPNT